MNTTTNLSPLTRTPAGSFTFESGGIAIAFPAATECGRFLCTPDSYGFRIFETGGGCTAWMREFTVEGRPVYMLVTDDDASHQIDRGGPVWLGVYDDADGSWINWRQDSADAEPSEFHGEGRWVQQ